jgi:Fe-S-cluster containining protein
MKPVIPLLPLDAPDRPVLNCFHCRGCCQGEIFAEPCVPLTPQESARFYRDVSFELDVPYLQVNAQKKQCVFYEERAGTCSVYDNRPLVCQVYPLSVIGNHVVIMSECPESASLIERWQAREPATVAFIERSIDLLDRADLALLEHLRYGSGGTDQLFVFGRIHDPTVE